MDYRAFEAALAEERWSSIRNGLAHLLAIAGVGCWCLAAWPDLIQGAWRRVPLGIWATLAVAWIYAIVMQRAWRRERAQSMHSGQRTETPIDRRVAGGRAEERDGISGRGGWGQA